MQYLAQRFRVSKQKSSRKLSWHVISIGILDFASFVILHDHFLIMNSIYFPTDSNVPTGVKSRYHEQVVSVFSVVFRSWDHLIWHFSETKAQECASTRCNVSRSILIEHWQTYSTNLLSITLWCFSNGCRLMCSQLAHIIFDGTPRLEIFDGFHLTLTFACRIHTVLPLFKALQCCVHHTPGIPRFKWQITRRL